MNRLRETWRRLEGNRVQCQSRLHDRLPSFNPAVFEQQPVAVLRQCWSHLLHEDLAIL